jgi:hypothetical protein
MTFLPVDESGSKQGFILQRKVIRKVVNYGVGSEVWDLLCAVFCVLGVSAVTLFAKTFTAEPQRTRRL